MTADEIIEIKNAFGMEECNAIECIVSRMPPATNRIRQHSGLEKILLRGIRRHFPTATSCGLVTICEDERPVGMHVDEVRYDETHKCLLYLNDVAGTEFFDVDRVRIVYTSKAQRGSMVIFPMTAPHRSQFFPHDHLIKRTVGVRLKMSAPSSVVYTRFGSQC